MTNPPLPNSKTTAYPAPPGWRLIALIYDALPMIPLTMIIAAAFLGLHGGRAIAPNSWLAYLEALIIWLVIGSYFVSSWRRGGQTMGMRPWRLQVVSESGRPATLSALCLRYLVASLTPGLCLIWTVFDSERRGLHDIVSHTLVVRRNG